MTETKEVNPNLENFQNSADATIRFMVVHAITELKLSSDEVLNTLDKILNDLYLLQIEATLEVMKEAILETGDSDSIPDPV